MSVTSKGNMNKLDNSARVMAIHVECKKGPLL